MSGRQLAGTSVALGLVAAAIILRRLRGRYGSGSKRTETSSASSRRAGDPSRRWRRVKEFEREANVKRSIDDIAESARDPFRRRPTRARVGGSFPCAVISILVVGAPSCAIDSASAKVVPAQSPAEPKPAAPATTIASVKDLYRWMLWYYEEPRPELTVPAIRFMGENAMLPFRSTTIPAFLAAVFRQNRTQIAPWLGQFDGLEASKRKSLLVAAWLSDTDEGRAYLAVSAARSPGLEGLIDELLAEKPPDIVSAAVPDASCLDMLWANYLATGDKRYVQRVIAALPRSDAAKPDTQTESDFEVALSGGLAAWSLGSNAQQHPAVLKICREELATAPAALRAVLQSVVDEAAKSPLGKEEVLAEVERAFRQR